MCYNAAALIRLCAECECTYVPNIVFSTLEYHGTCSDILDRQWSTQCAYHDPSPLSDTCGQLVMRNGIYSPVKMICSTKHFNKLNLNATKRHEFVFFINFNHRSMCLFCIPHFSTKHRKACY